ncbi:MAG: DnaJ domain-containing protein [Crocinitomicaceae bacterium]|nr:DnaJ domain-containing protein [Crocinitomicaceae bacterium]MDG1777568.1 DnaJ domain-containing protein [Crocinitomicaceae bacterium]
MHEIHLYQPISIPLIYLDPIYEVPEYVIALAFFTPIILGAFLLARNKRFNKQWKAGVFPEKYKFNQDHLLEAYLSLAALFIQNQKKEHGQKIVFVNSYFNRYFKKSNYNFSDSLRYSFKHPVKPNTVTNWLKKHIINKTERIHIIYFLVGITMIDGKVALQDKKLLALISIQLKLDLNDLEQILAMYASYQENNRVKGKYNKSNRRIQATIILGLKAESNADEIKKAYRKMVKLHHPDKFENAPPQQIKIAQEKFIQIQHAYEILNEKH